MRNLLIAITIFYAVPHTVLAQNALQPPAEEFVFRFQPPNGISVRQTYKMEKTRKTEGQPLVKDEAETQTEGTFRRVGDSFEYCPKIKSSTLRRNGTEINDPIIDLLSKVQITYVISKGGEATEIRGFSEVKQSVRSTMPAQVAAALAPFLNEASLVAREKAEWNARYSEYADGKFRIGEVIDVQAPQRLANGETINYTIRTSFPGWEPCPAGSCIRLKQIYESDAAELAKLVEGVLGSVASAASAPQMAPKLEGGATRITGSLSRLIDPKTMLIYFEQVKRTISMRVQVPGQRPLPTVQEESRTYTYSYE
ncbi:hypothetical protein [Roseateles sp.]|uniref:hypothetical protein n=1 Tax=Roseateles sp. TaxID=1971397 RepID=UPI003D11804C